jgi:hypothetical protein
MAQTKDINSSDAVQFVTGNSFATATFGTFCIIVIELYINPHSEKQTISISGSPLKRLEAARQSTYQQTY